MERVKLSDGWSEPVIVGASNSVSDGWSESVSDGVSECVSDTLKISWATLILFREALYESWTGYLLVLWVIQ